MTASDSDSSSSNLEGVNLGFLVGAIPTIAMIFASIFMTRMEVPKVYLAGIQCLAGGLILGAGSIKLMAP